MDASPAPSESTTVATGTASERQRIRPGRSDRAAGAERDHRQRRAREQRALQQLLAGDPAC